MIGRKIALCEKCPNSELFLLQVWENKNKNKLPVTDIKLFREFHCIKDKV